MLYNSFHFFWYAYVWLLKKKTYTRKMWFTLAVYLFILMSYFSRVVFSGCLLELNSWEVKRHIEFFLYSYLFSFFTDRYLRMFPCFKSYLSYFEQSVFGCTSLHANEQWICFRLAHSVKDSNQLLSRISTIDVLLIRITDSWYEL